MTKIQRYMKEQFIVSKIEMAQDGSPSVYIGFNDPAEHKSGEAKPLNPFGPKATAFSSPEDLMKNLPKGMGNIAEMICGADCPTFKLSTREYEDMGLRVGDKVSIEIKKKENSGI
jgi:hypothetical protein